MMSNPNFVQSFAERAHGQIPELTLWSAPIWLYKGIMLLWAFWLAASFVQWLRFGFSTLRKNGSSRAKQRPRRARTRSIRGTPGPTPPPDDPTASPDTERARVS